MERMASHTRRSEILGELFQALGNDPFVIGECLGKPILAERLLSSLAGYAGCKALLPSSAFTSELYKLPEISSLECADTWTPTTTVNAPLARRGHNALWTGSEMIVWGGLNEAFQIINTGAGTIPLQIVGQLRALSTQQMLDGFSAVWTGIEMIVWGGGGNVLNSGGRYNPITDTWTATSMANIQSREIITRSVDRQRDDCGWKRLGGNCILNTGGGKPD
jgi:hypothetical protein